MSRSSRHVGKPSPRYQAVALVGLSLLLNFGLPGLSLGQSPDTTKSDSASPPPHHRRRISLEWFRGPPSPEIMRDSMEVSGGSLQRYTRRYEEYMAATKPARDSVRANLQAMRTAFENGNRSEARARHVTVERQMKQLAERDQKFDDGLKDILNKDQQHRYQQWRESRQRRARGHWHHERRSRQNEAGWTLHPEETKPADSAGGSSNV